MMRIRSRAAIILIALAASCQGKSQAQSKLASRADCPSREGVVAECWGVDVPETRSGASRRNINLRIERIPATRGAGTRAIFIFQGGPGQAASTLADFYQRVYAKARDTHDIVLIDQRGTGGSNALLCDFGTSDANPQSYLVDMFDASVIRRCRAALEARADLSQYTTLAAVRDAEAVRAAFGYAQVDLYGTSYGTRVALEYARRYPSKTRTLTLKGIVAPMSVAPTDFARDVERSTQLMLRDCAKQPSCAAAFPALGADLSAAIAQLDRGPVTAKIDSGVSVELSRGLFGATMRSFLQGTPLRATLPSLIHAAAHDNWTPLVTRTIALRKAAQGEIATGLMLSVFCTEDVPYLDVPRARASAAKTVLGSYWVDQLTNACALWPRGVAPSDWRKPFRVDAPTLLISGELDPATPPSAVDAVRPYLVRSRSIVVPGGSHSFAGMDGCVDVAMSAFVAASDTSAVRDECATKIVPRPFVTTPNE